MKTGSDILYNHGGRTIHRFCAKSMFKVFVAVLTVLFSPIARAQVYPVQVSVSTTPPYYNFLAHYGDQNNHLLIIATLTDFSSPPVNARVRLKIEGPGFAAQTRTDMPVGNVFQLSPGLPVFIQGSDVLPLLQENALTITSGNPDFNNLPEGFTTICVEVVEDNANAAVLATNNCTAFFLQLMQPPQPFLPVCNSVADTSAVFQSFQWSPPQNYIPAIGTDLNYVFSLYEWIDTTNYNIFQSGQGLVYQTQTQFPMVQVSNFDLAWQQGRKYVWRVQAQITSNGLPVQMITNNGISAPCSFYYGKPQTLAQSLTDGLVINATAEAITNRKGLASWTVVDQTPNEGLSTYARYIVEYRKKPVEGDPDVFPWHFDTVTGFQLPIYQVEAEKTYQVRVSGLAGNFRSEPSTIAEFTTPPARQYACGEADLPYLPNNYQPLLSAHMGDVFQIGQFALEVTDILPLGTAGHYKGRGTIPHGFIGGARIKVRFDDLLVDSEYNVREGQASAITDGVDDWLNDQYLDQAGVDTTIAGIIESGGFLNDSTVFVVVGDDSLFFTFNGDLPIVIHGGDNVEYQFWPDGTMIVTTYGVVPSNDSLQATKNLLVRFEPASGEPAETNSFDKKEYSQFSSSYEAIVCQAASPDQFIYFVPNKSKALTGTAQVKAVVHANTAAFVPSELGFRVAGSSEFLQKTQINDSTYLLTLPERNSHYAVYAVYDELKLGKLNVKCYSPITKKVIIVPLVSMNLTEAEVETALNNIYRGANLTIDATIAPQFNTAVFTSGTQFTNPDVNLMSKYTTQMRALRDAYLSAHEVESGTYLLFIVPSFSNPQLDGYMVRGRGVGFVAQSTLNSLPAFAHTVAHELGHGIGALEHAWGETESLKGTTDNLMDYSNGTSLVKQQWEGLRNPSTFITFFDNEEEGELLTSDYFEESMDYTFPEEAYILSSEISVNDIFKAKNGIYFQFGTEQLASIDAVILRNGFVTAIMDHTGKRFKISTSYFNFSNAIVQESAIVLFYDNSIPNRNYTKLVGNKTYYLIHRDLTDISISEYIPCTNVSTYVYDYESSALKRRSPICPEPEDSPACNWTSNFILNNIGSCAFRINRSSIQCLKQVPVSTKHSLVSLLADKIIDMSESSNQAAYNSIDFDELGIEAPGWFSGVFNDGGAFDVGMAFVKLMQASVEQAEMREYLRNELSANQYELLRKFLVDWNFYEVTYPLIQLTNGLGGDQIASNRTTSVNIYGKTFTRSILTDPYIIDYTASNHMVKSDEFGCEYTASTQRMSMLANGTIQTNASFDEKFLFYISKQEFQNNGGEATPFLYPSNPNNLLGTPVFLNLNGQQFSGTEYQDYYLIKIPRTYSYSGKQLDPFEPLTFIFTENHNSLGVEEGRPYIMPAIWGLCMEKAINDEREELEGRVLADKLMSFGGIMLAPFTGGASLGLTFTTVGVAEYDLAYLEIQQNQTLQQYQDDETFRNAWNTVYTTVQIVDALVAAPAVLNSLDDLYRAVRQSKHLEAAKQYVSDDFFNFVKGRLANADEIVDDLADAWINGWTKEQVLAIPKPNRPNPNVYLSESYRNAHEAVFNQEGGAFIVVKVWIEEGGYAEFPLNKYAMLRSDMNDLIANFRASGNTDYLEDALGYTRGDLQGLENELYVFYPSSSNYSFEMPTGNEIGANSLWEPGGETSGGFKEAVMVNKTNPNAQITHNNDIENLKNQFDWEKIQQ